MEIINCIQGSEEWLRSRLGIATASNFSRIVTSKGDVSKQINDYSFQLAGEILTNTPVESYCSPDMQRGNALEPEAREAYQEEKLCKVDEIGFMKCDFYGYSPDGLVGNDGLLEIKCPKQPTHMKYLFANKLPTEYKAQVQGGLLVSERKWCDFVSYNPDFSEDKKLFIIREFRDEKFITKLFDALTELDERKNLILSQLKRQK